MRNTSETEFGVYVSLKDLVRLQHKARGFSFLPKQPIHSILSGKHTSKLRGRGLNFEELKNYIPGDDIRTMDWKATLRTGKPHVRVYTEERDRHAFMVVDQRAAMFFGSRFKTKSVIAAELGAVGAWRVLDQGDRAGAIIFNDSAAIDIKPHRSKRNVLRILNTIVECNHDLLPGIERPANPGMLNRVMEQVLRLAPHDSLICIITDMQGADPITRKLSTLLARHNDVIVGFVYDPLEQELPDAGRLVFSKGEHQLEIDTSGSKVKQGFSTHFNDRLAQARRILIQRAVPLVPISTADDPVEQIRRLLGYARSSRKKR
jgi:uncharacterized protein (DUF58 family)